MKYTLIKSLLIASVSVVLVYYMWEKPFFPVFSTLTGGSPQASTFLLMMILVFLISIPDLYKSKTQAFVGIVKLVGFSLLFTIIIYIGFLFLDLSVSGLF